MLLQEKTLASREDEFIATLAHELRNPLAPMRHALQLLRRGQADPSTLAKAHGMMERQVHQMTRLVDDLLDVSRIATGKIHLRTSRVDLEDIVFRAIEISRPAIDEARHQLRLALPPEPIFLVADPERLVQVLTNLLNNAAQYTPAGGEIWLRVDQVGDAAVIRIHDNGVGISADMQARIFDLFRQGPTENHKGLGIGLTLVRRLVDLHGGSVEVDSAGLGHGSEFIVCLPIAKNQAAAPPSRAAKKAVARPKSASRILVVDDFLDSADSLASLLRLEGKAVCVAYDGPQALKVAETFSPEAVLLDIGLPGMDGCEVARRLRAAALSESPIVIAMTGWGKSEKSVAPNSLFDHYLVKPVELDALMGMLIRP